MNENDETTTTTTTTNDNEHNNYKNHNNDTNNNELNQTITIIFKGDPHGHRCQRQPGLHEPDAGLYYMMLCYVISYCIILYYIMF